MSTELETREITLPVSGEQVVIREGDGFSDRLLLKKIRRPYEAVHDYVASLTVSIGDNTKVTARDIKNLLVPDHEYIVVECFKLNYGDSFEFSFTCPSCSHEEAQAVPLNDLELRPIPEGTHAPDPIFVIDLPRSGRRVEVGMLNGHKESKLLAMDHIDLNQTDFLSIRKIDGSTEFSYEEVLHLPMADHRALRGARKKLVCGYDTNIIVRCPECGEKTRLNLLMHPDFLLPGG